MLCALLLVGCSSGIAETTPPAGGPVRRPVLPGASDVGFNQLTGQFSGDQIPNNPKYFDMLLGDMDLDGDLDFFLNRHNLQRPELFENNGGYFDQVNRRGLDLSGLYDNPGIAELYASTATMEAAIDARGVPGIYVWHEPEVTGRWVLRVVPAEGVVEHTLRLVTNRPMTVQSGLTPSEWTRSSPFELQLRVETTFGPRTFQLANIGINTQLLVSTVDAAPFGLFAGTEFHEFPERTASLWKQDPHGMALVDCVGGPEPDLFVSGGGLAGNHLPPHDPQADRLFRFDGAPTLFAEVDASVIPADYGRGRQTMWVDYDGDGENELYVSNRQTPNVLLERTSSGTFENVAPAVGLDLNVPESYAWTDVDLDGNLDLVYLLSGAIGVAYARGGTFELTAGAAIGLALPGPVELSPGLFEETTFHLFDMDRDGDLDIWLSRVGSMNKLVAFRNDGGTYTSMAGPLGIADANGQNVIVADIDNDGWQDLVVGGQGLFWWRNLLGESFEQAPLDEGFGSSTSKWFTTGDVDQDGRIDIVMMTSLRRQVLRNRTAGENRLLEVHPTLPLGTVVRAYHPDGTVFAQQWGAATVTRYSQSLQPLRFGQAPGVSVTEIGVQLPGDAAERYRVDVPPGAESVDL